jgi:peptidylprolyl isomerase
MPLNFRRPPALALLALGVLAAGAARSDPKPPIMSLLENGKEAVAPKTAPKPTAQDWKTLDPRDVVVIDTNKGRIFVELAPAVAPKTVEQIRNLVRQGFYDGQRFFRVIDDFMDQTGDPENKGTGGSKLPNVPPEFTFRRSAATPFALVSSANGVETGLVGPVPVTGQPIQLAAFTADNAVNAHAVFCSGVAGLARAGAPDSGNSQFFLMRAVGDSLAGNYAAWGRVVAGEDVVRAIKTGEPPSDPMDQMTKVQMLSDIPAASRPQVEMADTSKPWFAAYVGELRAQEGGNFSICDIDLPSKVN